MPYDVITLPDGTKLAARKFAGEGPGGADVYSEVDQTQLDLVSPVRTSASATVTAGATENLDGATIPASTTGELVMVVVSSSVAAKWEIVSRDGGVEVELGTIFTSGIAGGRPTETFYPPSKRFCTLAGNGDNENFRVKVTNLDAENTADCYATILADEVS